MNREELKQYLPHREPMLLMDEIDIDQDGIAHARYRIREDEFFCQGHFPGNPMVPGIIQCEIMAQSCALLVKDEIVGKTYFLLRVFRALLTAVTVISSTNERFAAMKSRTPAARGKSAVKENVMSFMLRRISIPIHA